MLNKIAIFTVNISQFQILMGTNNTKIHNFSNNLRIKPLFSIPKVSKKFGDCSNPLIVHSAIKCSIINKGNHRSFVPIIIFFVNPAIVKNKLNISKNPSVITSLSIMWHQNEYDQHFIARKHPIIPKNIQRDILETKIPERIKEKEELNRLQNSKEHSNLIHPYFDSDYPMDL